MMELAIITLLCIAAPVILALIVVAGVAAEINRMQAAEDDAMKDM